MKILRQSTEVIVRIGPFPDVGDGFTPQIDITLGAADEAELLKAGSVEVDISGRTWAAVTNCRGWYDLTLTTDDTNTVGILTVVVQDDSDCLPVSRDFQVVEEAVYDEIFKAAATGVSGVIGTAGANLTNINLPNQAMDITGNITGNLSGSVGSVSGAVGSVAGAVGSVTGDVTTDSASRTASKAGAAEVGGAEVDLTKIHGSALSETSSGYLAAAFIKLFDVVTPLLVASAAMRGTENASTHTPASVKTAMEAEESVLATLYGLIANSKMAAQVKGTDNIDFSATQKTSLNESTPVNASNSIYN